MFLLDLFQGVGGNCGRPLTLDILFWGLLLRGSYAEKWGDHQKKKFFINNFFEAVRETSGPIGTAFTVGGGGGTVPSNIPGNVLKQILIHKLQHFIRGIYENRGVYYFH